jgi:hypothetical protein
MISDLFSALLQELGRALQIPDLHPDRNNSCLIKMKSNLKIQIELNPSTGSLIVATDFGLIPPGRYKEDLFKEALKANGMPPPRYGIFAYSRQTGHLVMFEELNTKDLSGEKIADLIAPFEEKALKWVESIKRHEVPVVGKMKTSGVNLGMFGLRP